MTAGHLMADVPPGRQQCTARSKSSGGRCRRLAVPGGTVCRWHGGSAPQVQRAAARRLALERLEGEVAQWFDAAEAEARGGHPVDLLLDALARSAAMAAVLSEVVRRLEAGRSQHADAGDGLTVEVVAGLWGPDHLGDARPHVAVEQLRVWNEQAGRLAKLALDAGVEERRVRLVEAQAAQLVQVIEHVTVAAVAEVRTVDTAAAAALEAAMPGLIRQAIDRIRALGPTSQEVPR